MIRREDFLKYILLVEDDASLNHGIVLSLKQEGYHFTQCFSLEEGKAAWQRRAYDLAILDINLPDGSGLAWCAELRKDSSVPILFLTANDTEIDIVAGLESGGDDYITKPFSLAVLRARVGALLRRSQGERVRNLFERPPFRFDFEGFHFAKNGRAIELSKTESRLLKLLVQNPGQTLTRNTLLQRVWDDAGDFVDENALSVTVRRLRNKLESDPSKPQYIKTVYGIGYSWAVEE